MVVFLVTGSANASELRQVVYEFAARGNWTASPTHVICDNCPEKEHLNGIPRAVSVAVIKMLVPSEEVAPATPHTANTTTEELPVSKCTGTENNNNAECIPDTYTTYFALNSVVISTIEEARLKSFAQHIPSKRIDITGYTCEIGSKKYNDRLATRRAKAVADVLNSVGIDKDRMSVGGQGKCCFMGQSKELDRRVEIKVREISNDKGSKN